MTNTRSDFFVGADLEVRFKGEADNDKCLVDQWAIKLAEGKFFLANLIMPLGAPEGARWLLGSIAAAPAGTPVWAYRDDKRVQAGFEGHVFSTVLDGETFLVYATKGRLPEVVHTVPLRDILARHEVEVSLDVRLARKRAIANELGFGVAYTATESVLVKHFAERDRLAEAERLAQEAEARQAARQAKVDEILARKHLRVYAGGRHVEAIWVVDGEWQMLPPKTKVILGVIEDGKFFAKETFTVYKGTKRGSAPEKSFVASVGLEPATTTSAATRLPEPIATKVVILEGTPFEVPSFAKVEDLQAHRLAGLNSGAVRGVLTGNGLALYRVRKDGIEAVKADAFTVIG